MIEAKNSFAKLEVCDNVKPVFCKSRAVPLAMKKKIQEELDKLEKDGIIRKVQNSNWAAPLVPVIKPTGKLRLLKRFICLVEVHYHKVNLNSDNKMFLHVKFSSPIR